MSVVYYAFPIPMHHGEGHGSWCYLTDINKKARFFGIMY